MPNLVIAVVGSVLVVINAVLAKVPTYHWSPLFLVPAIWAPYGVRRWLDLRPAHYAMFVAAILLHDIGAYGFYQHSPLPFSFDIAVHFFFAFAVSFGVYHLLLLRLKLSRLGTGVATVFFIMGCGAMHEIMEFMSYLLLGEKNGMLKPTTSYFFDTQRDLTNNLLGVLLALACIAVYRLAVAARPAATGFDVRPGESPSAAR
jgi:uncharacterized membrane protein YjdF